MPYCGITQTVFSAADQCQASADFIFRKKTKIAGQKEREKLERERTVEEEEEGAETGAHMHLYIHTKA